MRQDLLVAVMLLLSACQSAPVATPPANDSRIPRIQAAAAEIAAVQKKSGNFGALAAVKACEERAAIPSGTVQEAEICAAQDWLISKTSIAFLTKLGATNDVSYRAAKGAPERVLSLLIMKGYTGNQVRSFLALVDRFGLPAFAGSRF
jgi:hypothetical protein